MFSTSVGVVCVVGVGSRRDVMYGVSGGRGGRPTGRLVLMGAAATLCQCDPSEPGPGSDADQAFPRGPLRAGAHSGSGGDAAPPPAWRLLGPRVFPRGAWVRCEPGQRPRQSAVLLVLFLVG